MSRNVVVSTFESEEDILGATQAVREHGWKVLDAYTPYAVHGLDKAMGLQRSRLPLVCFLLGLAGAGLKVWFEFWTTAVSWPVNVGGKPFNSLPAFVPVTFEVMVLFAGVSTVFAFFYVARLFPGRKPVLVDPGVTDNRFVLVLEESDATFDFGRVKRLLARYNALKVEERVEDVEPEEDRR
jgi:hypothetical protein